MTTNILTLENYIEQIKTKSPRLYNEYKAFDCVVDLYREGIAKHYKSLSNNEMIVLTVEPCIHDGTIVDVYASFVCVDIIRSRYNNCYTTLPDLLTLSNLGAIPIYCQWNWDSDFKDTDEYKTSNPPQSYLGFIPTPFRWAEPVDPTPRPKRSKKPVVLEKTLEDGLLAWIHSYGIKADNQVSVGRHRTDIWIPGHCFLELKRSKVSGDDVCQAMDYCSQYKKPVVLVGNHISEMASRGIEAFNKAVESEMIVFISWSGVRTYLKGLLDLGKF